MHRYGRAKDTLRLRENSVEFPLIFSKLKIEVDVQMKPFNAVKGELKRKVEAFLDFFSRQRTGPFCGRQKSSRSAVLC